MAEIQIFYFCLARRGLPEIIPLLNGRFRERVNFCSQVGAGGSKIGQVDYYYYYNSQFFILSIWVIEFLTASHHCLSTSTDCLRFGHGLLLLTSPIVFASVVGLTFNKLKHGTDV